MNPWDTRCFILAEIQKRKREYSGRHTDKKKECHKEIERLKDLSSVNESEKNKTIRISFFHEDIRDEEGFQGDLAIQRMKDHRSYTRKRDNNKTMSQW